MASPSTFDPELCERLVLFIFTVNKNVYIYIYICVCVCVCVCVCGWEIGSKKIRTLLINIFYPDILIRYYKIFFQPIMENLDVIIMEADVGN